jgi:hypothetical protein
MARPAGFAFVVPPHSPVPVIGLGTQEVIAAARFAPSLPGNWRTEKFEDEFGSAGVMLTPDWSEDFVLVLFRQGGLVNFATLINDEYEFVAAAGNVESLFPVMTGVIERRRKALAPVGDNLN